MASLQIDVVMNAAEANSRGASRQTVARAETASSRRRVIEVNILGLLRVSERAAVVRRETMCATARGPTELHRFRYRLCENLLSRRRETPASSRRRSRVECGHADGR